MTATARTSNFLRRIVAEDVEKGTHGGRVHTRFPPEPNGYLHIGHAKSICLNFGLAQEYGGKCNLRFDDTNPEKEEVEYVESIKDDVRWLGFDWDDRLFFASDYFDKLYAFAVELIRKGLAYVDHQDAETIRATRGTLTEPGRDSPYRDRTIDENLALFGQMRAGKFRDGECVLRAKIDMAAPNLNLRDPPLYRIRHAAHHRTGDRWCLYPLYDFTHGLSDAIEHITHSICTLEFEDHRPLYDWFIAQVSAPSQPRQYEFARLNLDYTVLSKRRLIELVNGGHVAGWDDPRMPTLSGLRRRGVTPEALRDFCERIGVTRNDTRIDLAVLENCIREHLGASVPRALAVLEPLKVVIEDWPAGKVDKVPLPNHPQHPDQGTRNVPFGREICIERDDFMESPPKDFFRLAPGREVRLRGAYLITCREVVRDAAGAVVELRCTHDPASRGGNAPDGRKVKGTIHWASPLHALRAEVRLYDRLFKVADPDADGADWKSHLNPDSVRVLQDCLLEPSLGGAAPGDRFQFERLGYFCADAVDHRPDRPVFNRTVTLKDTWARQSRT
jgi:glutaminyl-tRNA synthetase